MTLKKNLIKEWHQGHRKVAGRRQRIIAKNPSLKREPEPPTKAFPTQFHIYIYSTASFSLNKSYWEFRTGTAF